MDLDKPGKSTEPPVRMQTTVLCPSGDGDETIWEVEVQVERKNNGRIDLVVKYDRGENPHLNHLDTGYWGANRIIIKKGQDRGKYHWKGDDKAKIKSEDGWRKEELLEEKFRKCYLKIERGKEFQIKNSQIRQEEMRNKRRMHERGARSSAYQTRRGQGR